jgi:hypothetical protein
VLSITIPLFDCCLPIEYSPACILTQVSIHSHHLTLRIFEVYQVRYKAKRAAHQPTPTYDHGIRRSIIQTLVQRITCWGDRNILHGFPPSANFAPNPAS